MNLAPRAKDSFRAIWCISSRRAGGISQKMEGSWGSVSGSGFMVDMVPLGEEIGYVTKCNGRIWQGSR